MQITSEFKDLKVKHDNTNKRIESLFHNYELQMSNFFKNSMNDYNEHFNQQLVQINDHMKHIDSQLYHIRMSNSTIKVVPQPQEQQIPVSTYRSSYKQAALKQERTPNSVSSKYLASPQPIQVRNDASQMPFISHRRYASVTSIL